MGAGHIDFFTLNTPEVAVKLRILVYYVHDPAAAKRLAEYERQLKNTVMPRDASVFHEADAESCDRVYIMPDVVAVYRETLVRAYGDRVVKTLPPSESYAPNVTAPILAALEEQEPLPVASIRDEAQGATPTELDLMTKRELREHAAARGIHLDPALAKRDDLLAAIRAASP